MAVPLVAIPHFQTFVNLFENWLGGLKLHPICDESICKKPLIFSSVKDRLKALDGRLFATKENVKKSWSERAELKDTRMRDPWFPMNRQGLLNLRRWLEMPCFV